MFRQIDDTRIAQLRPLISPAILMEELPANDRSRSVVAGARDAAIEIIEGRADRMLVIVGPCSVHDTGAAREYAKLLKSAADRLAEDLLVVMRVYFEKPRTTVGWKGLINDPGIDGSFQINRGLHEARSLLVDLAELGLPAGTEFLDTITPQFLADLVAWGAIGARTTESQVHRELASGLSMPVGFKNGTGGSIQIAIDAIRSAAHSHCFLSVTKLGTSAIVETLGNTACHLILRGSSRGPNYDADSIAEAVGAIEKAGLVPSVMVDCSHGNSGKDHTRQPMVASDVAAQVAAGSTAITGVMLESHLVGGRQSWDATSATYGQSITDACMAWEATVPVLEELAAAVRARRGA